MPKAHALTLFVFAIAAAVSLSACDLATNYTKFDRTRDMEVQDYRDSLAPREPELPPQASVAGSEPPPFMSYVAPVSEHLKPMPLVSISVNQTVPLRDVLFELADQADYDIELDPRISGSVIFTARNRPFDLVVDRITKMAGLRYEFKNDMLRVELDTPYQKNYKIDYLNLVRTSTSDVSNNVAVVSGEGADTGSSFSASTQNKSNFWEELSVSLQQILATDRSADALRTSTNPQITAVAEQTAPVAQTAPAVEGEGASETPPPAAPPAVLRVDSLPVGDEEQEEMELAQSAFSLNRQAGIVTVFATKRQHDEVSEYLAMLRRAVGSQVLIEAKVLEVALNDEFATGIDWNALLLSGDLGVGWDIVSETGVRPLLDPVVDPSSDFFLTFLGNDITAGIQAIARFGTVRALSSPRLTVLNNQSAVLNVADNRVYFEIDIDVTTDEGVTSTEIDSEIKNVPEGVLINVIPSIDLDSGEISMAVRPTVTRIVEFINDPAVAYVTSANNIDNVVSQIPVVNIQEMDSIIKVPSGKAIVMGGLMQDTFESEQNAVPVLGELPVFGSLFRTQGDAVRKTELVIFLKATIVDAEDTIHPTDKDLYRTFAQDRRPLRF
ncbi:MAG: pilus (MSHA type) biogenesis protein MshL [Alphaproteobacteria bacterium]|nr:pilus (MSHA type) biogenesis protein MshL [Alphaproteobacteria bacterium]